MAFPVTKELLFWLIGEMGKVDREKKSNGLSEALLSLLILIVVLLANALSFALSPRPLQIS